MNSKIKFIVSLSAAIFTQTVQSAQTITWQLLRPEPVYSESLTFSEKALIREIYAYEFAMETRYLSPMEFDGYQKRIQLAERSGIDVNKAVEQITYDESSTHNVIDGLALSDIKLGGFLVPLEMTDFQGTEFILVPTAGACIHSPPPPINQTVLVEFPQGYKVSSLYKPVWVNGDLKTVVTKQLVSLSDGSQKVQIGYVINATSIKEYQYE